MIKCCSIVLDLNEDIWNLYAGTSEKEVLIVIESSGLDFTVTLKYTAFWNIQW